MGEMGRWGWRVGEMGMGMEGVCEMGVDGDGDGGWVRWGWRVGEMEGG